MTYPPVTDGQHAMLRGLAESRRPIAIAEELGVTKQCGTGYINALVSRGLVVRNGSAPWIEYLVTQAGQHELAES